jgi:hypothetical protein
MGDRGRNQGGGGGRGGGYAGGHKRRRDDELPMDPKMALLASLMSFGDDALPVRGAARRPPPAARRPPPAARRALSAAPPMRASRVALAPPLPPCRRWRSTRTRPRRWPSA